MGFWGVMTSFNLPRIHTGQDNILVHEFSIER